MNESLKSILGEDYEVIIFEVVERNIPNLVNYEFPNISLEEIYKFNFSKEKVINTINCEVIYEENSLKIISNSKDPYFELSTDFSFNDNKKYYFEITMSTESSGEGQIFYKKTGEKYNEKNSVKFNLKEGKNTYTLEIPSDIEKIRIDPIRDKGEVIIENISILVEAQ